MPERIAPDGLPEAVAEITATLSAVVLRKDGTVEDKGVLCRRIVSNAFLQMITDSMRANASAVALLQTYKYHEWGTDTTSEAATQTGCIAPAAPTDVTLGTAGTQAGSTNTYVSVKTITATGNVAITEHCIHPEATASTNGLDRSKFTAINLTSGDSIQFTYTLTLTGA